MDDLTDPLTLFAVSAGAALFSVETGGRRLLAIAKPLATVSLAGVAWRGGTDLLSLLVLAGIGLSVLGDVFLLFESEAAFLLGIVLFLGAHLAYTAAFVLFGMGALWTPAVGVGIFGAASGWLVQKLWGGASSTLRGPVVLYAAAITAMTASAYATLAGPWPPAAAAAAATGALFFYFSDAILAWNRFVEPFRHGATVTLALYWLGQLLIALAARAASG